MKILLSAFNCDPFKGSEESFGWAWSVELAQMGHEVWVITQAENQPNIEKALSTKPLSNLHFFYYEFSPPSSAWWMFEHRRAGLLPQRLELEWRLLRWQWNAYQMAKSLAQEVAFECVHHVTNSCVRRSSFMGLLRLPFIVGPLAGGLKTPWFLRKSYPFMGWLLDLSRDFANSLIRFNPLMHLTLAQASKIYCDSKQTQALIPGIYRSKSQVLFAMPVPEMTGTHQVVAKKSTEQEAFRILFVGRFLFWKGLHLGLKAFAQLHQKFPSSRLTAIGKGPEENWLKGLGENLGVKDAIEWVPWMNHEELSLAYIQHDVFLFPSLHDMGGSVILEAFAHGLPVVCLDLGGPGVIVNESCGRVIRTEELREEEVIQLLSDSLIELATDPELRYRLSEGARSRTSQFVWRDVVEQVYPDLSVKETSGEVLQKN